MPVPLGLKNDDWSPEACELRLHHYQSLFHRTGGRGFRVAPGTSPKRKKPRRGWGEEPSRIETLVVISRYGERHAEPAI